MGGLSGRTEARWDVTVEELEGFLDLISPQITMSQVEAADNICQAFESFKSTFDSCNRARQAAETDCNRYLKALNRIANVRMKGYEAQRIAKEAIKELS